MKNNKKNNFFTRNAKWFFLTFSLIVFIILIYLIMKVGPQKIAYGESGTNSITNFFTQSIKNGVQMISAKPNKTFSLDLYNNNTVYVMSKNGAPCNDYRNTMLLETFAFRCKTLKALYRGLWTKKIDVAGYNKLKINANLTVNNYTKNYFPECNYQGVDSNDSVDLIALSSDPNPKLNEECNHVVGEDKWSHCSITNKDVSAITHCGIPQCSSNKSCDMSIDVSGKNEIYLLFSVADDWFADVEGVLSNVIITLTK